MGEHTHEREEREGLGDRAEHADKSGGGVAAVRYLMANGAPDPARMAGLLVQYAVEADEMIALMHATLGNTYVGQVLRLRDAATNGPGNESTDATDVLSGDVHQSAGPAPTTGTDPVAVLIALKPTGTRGPKGSAKWLLDAIGLGLVKASGHSLPQLQAFADDAKTIHSNEKKPGSKAIEEAGRKKAVDKGHPIDNVHDANGGYDVDLDEAPILSTMVEVARKRISAWSGSGKPAHVVLELDDFVRGDPGYGGSQHTAGRAVDMNLSEAEAIALLSDLPPGKARGVFPDTSFHINNDGAGYDFGFIFGGEFFPPELELEHVKQEEIKNKGSDHTKELHAEGLVWGSWNLNRTTAKWVDGTGWKWSPPVHDGTPDARNYLKSAKLKDTLANLGKNKP